MNTRSSSPHPDSSEFSLAPCVTIVTGAGSGIGKAIAKRFCSAGSYVTLADINHSNLELVMADLLIGVGLVSLLFTAFSNWYRGTIIHPEKKLLQILNINSNKNLPKLNHQNERKKETLNINASDYIKYYDKESKTLVNDILKKEIEFFGYTFPNTLPTKNYCCLLTN